MSSSELPFGADVIQAITDHMNTDHPEDNALIVRALGGQPHATTATMTGLDATHAHFEAEVGGAAVAVPVPWGVPITERATVRHEVVRMYHEACQILGVEPRGQGEH